MKCNTQPFKSNSIHHHSNYFLDCHNPTDVRDFKKVKKDASEMIANFKPKQKKFPVESVKRDMFGLAQSS